MQRQAPNPEQPPQFPIPDERIKTPLLKQARGLLSEWETRAAYVREIRTRIEERKAEVGQLESEYHAELRRCAEEGIVSDKDEALLARYVPLPFSFETSGTRGWPLPESWQWTRPRPTTDSSTPTVGNWSRSWRRTPVA